MSKLKMTMAMLALATLGLGFGDLQARPVVSAILGFGTGTDPDQNNARSYAKDDAESKLTCVGTVENTRTVITGCQNSGTQDAPNWTCTATSTARCLMGQ
jgi:hypothetical protein